MGPLTQSSDLQVSKLNRCRIFLHFIGDDLIPDNVTNQLGVNPTQTELGRKALAVFVSKDGVRGREYWPALWRLDIPPIDSGDVNQPILEMFGAMTGDLKIWQDLSAKFNGTLRMILDVKQSDEAIDILPSTFKLLADRGIRVNASVKADIIGGD